MTPTPNRIATLVSVSAAMLIALSGCGGAATPRPIAEQPKTIETGAPRPIGGAPVATSVAAQPPAAPQDKVSERPAGVPLQPTAASRPADSTVPQPPIQPESRPRPVTATPAPRPLPADNEFKDYGVNPFVNPERDRLSTFGLDVDTASYSIAKRYLREGSLPPYESVRAEEFINAFKQGYPTPRDVAFGLYADGARSPFHTDGSYLIRIGVQGYRVPASQRKPAVFVFVVDESGSMSSENRIELAKGALRMLIDRLTEGDQVGIVAFTNTSRVVIEPTPVESRRALDAAIDTIYPKGSTHLQSGLELGYKMASRAYRAGSNNRVILMSDGVANEGGIRPDQILASVQEYARRGIALTSVGVGFGNYNDTLMETLADKSEGGNYLYINSLADAQTQLVSRVSALQTIARDAKIQVEFNPDAVEAYRLIGYENRAVADRDFRNDAVKGGGLGAGHSATALYQIRIKPGAQGRLATANLRWNDPDTNRTSEINGNVNTWDLTARFDAAAPRFQLAATVAQFAEVLRRSQYADRVSLGDLAERASTLADQMSEDADVVEFAQLAARAARIR